MKQFTGIQYFIFIVFISLAACSGHFDPETQTQIQGKFSNHNGEMIFLKEIQLNAVVLVDSARLDEKGEFKMIFTNGYKAGFYILGTQDISNAVQLVLKAGDKIEIEADASNIKQSYQIKNSPESMLLKEFNMEVEKSMNRADSIYFSYRNANVSETEKPELRLRTDSLLGQNQVLHYEMVRSFAAKNKNTLASILMLYSRYGEKQVLDLELDYDLFSEVSKAVLAAYPGNFHAIELQKQVATIENKKNLQKSREESLAVGKIFPDFVLNNQDNQTIQFSSLKGKKLLVYFWKASDASCWDTNKQLLELYKKHKSKNNFEIVAVSLDTERMQWISAINIDKLNWVNLLGNESTASNFNLSAFPRMFFIDENLVIKAKDFAVSDVETLIQP